MGQTPRPTAMLIQAMNQPLVELTGRLRASIQKQATAVLFDLDSTLFCVSPRTEHILRQFGISLRAAGQFERAGQLLGQIDVGPDEYNLRRLLARTGLEEIPELFEQIREYWREHFFSDRHLERDFVYPGAAEYVTKLQAWGAEIFYLTGRPERRMRLGTEKVLADAGFPALIPGQLLMKPQGSEPDQHLSDEHFKVTELKRLALEYKALWFFENEPLIIHDVRALVPDVEIIFVDSVHAGLAAPPEGLTQIKPDYRLK